MTPRVFVLDLVDPINPTKKNKKGTSMFYE